MDFSKYIGRDYKTYNCFDLVKEFYLDQLGIELKNYFEGPVVPSKPEIEFLVTSNAGDFQKVGAPSFGDVVAIRLYGYTSHIGVCLSKEKFLHSVRATGSCMDSLHRYKKMIEGYYRISERVL